MKRGKDILIEFGCMDFDIHGGPWLAQTVSVHKRKISVYKGLQNEQELRKWEHFQGA